MKIPFIILTLLASCTTQEVVLTSNEQKPMNSDTITTKKDTAARFTAIKPPAYTIDDTITMDDFPVTDLMVRNNSKDIQIDSIISFDKAWFYNQKNKQVLIFEFATDYYRMETYLFSEEYLKEYMPSFLFHKKSNKQYTAIGEKEAENESVSVRQRSVGDVGTMQINEFAKLLEETINNELDETRINKIKALLE